MVMSGGFVEPNDIELDLDEDQPVKAKKSEGAWGLYEELAKTKEENGTTPTVAEFGIAREAGTNGVTHIGGRLHSFDADGEQLPENDWFSLQGGSSSAGVTSADAGGAFQDELVFGDEAFTQATNNDGFGRLNNATNRLLDQLEVGETGTIAFKPQDLNLANNQHVNSNEITDENGDLANGIPILEVTKIDEQLKRANDSEVRFSTSWQGTGTNELVLDSTPVNGADFAQKLNALISTDDNLGPFSWSNISLMPTEETREDGIPWHINLDLKDIDDPEGAGRRTHNQQIGASNQPNEDSDAYTYEYSSTSSWSFKEIYSNLKEGESATWELDTIYINNGQYTHITKNSERIDSPLKVTLVETNPNPTSSSLDLEGLSYEIDSEIAIQTIFDEQGELDKSFIDSLINSDGQSVDFHGSYNAKIDGQDFHFWSSARETEWNGKQLQEEFRLPWNSLDFFNAAIESGVEELELTRDWTSVHVDSDVVRESYWANINRDGHIQKGRNLPHDYEGDPIDPVDPSSILNTPETITLTMGDLQSLAEKFTIDESRPDVLRFGDYELSNQLLSLDNALVDSLSGDAVEYVAVLGSQAERAGDYRLDITAESLSQVHSLEAVEVTIQLDPKLFEAINLSDIQISSQLPIQNAIQIDNEAGTVTLSGASLSNLGQGSMINGEEALASINLNFDNEYLETVTYNDVTGELELSPISFQMSVGEEEAVFSRDFTDSTGQLNRDIQSLAELNGEVALNSNRVSLIKEIVRMEEESGLTLGTQRTIGVKGEFTNLVREGATLEATTEWRNTGNTTVDGLQVEALENENARLVDAQFSEGKDYLASGRFINGKWNAEAAGSTEITAQLEVTGKAGNVLDLSEGILGVSTETSDEVFENEEGSKNLITYQGDLNYDGRVSFKDLAYLNAGAARQELVDKVDASGKEVTNEFGSVEQVATEESYASDVDANYDGKVSIADLSVLEKDWGKSLHTGDESFLGSGEKLDFESIDGDGTWDNSSFKRENAVAAKQIAEAQEAAGAISEAVDEGAGGGLNDGPSEVQEDDGLIGSEVVY